MYANANIPPKTPSYYAANDGTGQQSKHPQLTIRSILHFLFPRAVALLQTHTRSVFWAFTNKLDARAFKGAAPLIQ